MHNCFQFKTTNTVRAKNLVPKRNIIAYRPMTKIQGSPYLQHRVATLLVQHGRRHQNHPTRNPFLKSCRFRLCLGPGCCCQLVCFEFGVLHFRLPLYTRNGQVGEHVLLLWFLALVLAGCCCQLVCFEFFVLHFRLPIPETRNGQIIEHVRTQKATNTLNVCMYVCMVITYSRVWINRVRLPILLVVS